jgi:calcineurin-like phosphoesterase family protein
MIYKERGYKTFEDMIVDNWNSVVSNDDTIIHLGDVFLSVGRYLSEHNIEKDRRDYMIEFIKKLNGKKYLILGNHDYRFTESFFKKAGFEDIFDYLILENDYLLTHYPLVKHSYQSKKEKDWIDELIALVNEKNVKYIIHGHTHSRNVGLDNHFNVSVENIDFTPIEFDEVKRKFEKSE